MTTYDATYLIVDPDGRALFEGDAGDIRTGAPLPIHDPDPGKSGSAWGLIGDAIRQDCDRRGGFPAGRVVVTSITEVTA